MQRNPVAATGSLFNIKQAAAFLNVSEISLRRWTDSGRLSCLRVGPKRERRFRREDLEAFLEKQGASVPRRLHVGAPTGPGHILLEGIAIEHGNHLCCLYESDMGRGKLAVPFLADGLAAGDACFLVAPQGDQRAILDQLATVRRELDEDVRKGALTLSGGAASADSMIGYLERSFIEATRARSQPLRLLGEMIWALSAGMSTEELFRFEMRYNQTLARRFPVVSLCQYDVRRFTGVDVLAALRCHEDTFDYPLSRFLG